MLDVAIVIPCADDLLLASCLASIDEDVEVVVALNGATQEVKDIVYRFGVRWCETAERNLSRACNMGVECANASSVILMNSDCIFEKGAIRKLHQALDETCMVARGRVIFDTNSWTSSIVGKTRAYEYAKPHHIYQPALILKKDIIHAIGYYFDVDIHWGEDADLMRRIWHKGLKHRMVPDAVIHHVPLTIVKDLRSAYRYGIGRRISEDLNLIGTQPRYRIRPFVMLRKLYDTTRSIGLINGFYLSIIFSIAYSCGYYAQKRKDVYSMSQRIQERLGGSHG